MEAAKNHKIKNIIITSTSEVYGTAYKHKLSENDLVNAQSPYAASKIAADQLALSYNLSFNSPIKIIRPFNTFGPRQSFRAVIPTIISQILNKKRLKLVTLIQLEILLMFMIYVMHSTKFISLINV